MSHLMPDALERYLLNSSPSQEKAGVAWHFEHCPICKEEFTVRELMEIATRASARPAAIRSQPDQGRVHSADAPLKPPKRSGEQLRRFFTTVEG